jgi:probable rRNA maturation factor
MHATAPSNPLARHTAAPHAADEGGPAEPADPDQPPGLGVSVHAQLDEPPPWLGWLRDQSRRLAELAGVREGRVSIAIVDDALMAELHEQYKGVAGTTDVLTFDLREGPGGADDPGAPGIDADVAVCIDEAGRQAAARGHAVRLELLLYVVHALLHLTGYDDDTDEHAAAMHAREDELLTAAGFGAVYDQRQ